MCSTDLGLQLLSQILYFTLTGFVYLFIYLVAVVVRVRSEREDSRLENIITLTLSSKKKSQNARTTGMCFRNILSLSIGYTLHWGATGFFFFVVVPNRSQ